MSCDGRFLILSCSAGSVWPSFALSLALTPVFLFSDPDLVSHYGRQKVMANVNELKRLVEHGDPSGEPVADPNDTLLEVFCVDTSISMARSQTFPYIFGESKLSLCKRIITQGFVLPDHCTLYTALVKFNATPELAVPFAIHTPEQVRPLMCTSKSSCVPPRAEYSLTLPFYVPPSP